MFMMRGISKRLNKREAEDQVFASIIRLFSSRESVQTDDKKHLKHLNIKT